MDIVRLSISRPVGVTVAVLLLVMFGLIGLTAIPIQLTPTVDRPILTVTTVWPGRSPQEIVDEITKEQEERLKSVSNLKSMRSVSQEGTATVSLEFYVGSDLSRAMQEVNDALRQVPSYPADVEEPTIKATEGEAANAIAWIIIDVKPEARARHPDFDITTLFNALDKEVKPFLERIDGVAEINVYGGREREMRVLLDPRALADRQIRAQDVISVLRSQNENISAGTIAEGKRDYRVRVIGQYGSAEEILDTIVAYRDGRPVYVRDLGTVELGYEKRRGFVRSLGTQSIAINAIRQSGANVMDVMSSLRERLAEVESDILPNLGGEVGPDLRLRQVYDETVYIDSSIDLVTQNLWVGGALAGIVLLVFLRSIVTTGVIAMAIPVSVIGTFLVMLAFGRSLNVVSLAGLAFAVGMVVDNAIVVLENIYRHLQMGKRPMQAAYDGGREVWGAVLASTLTTVAVFVPVLTIQEEAGQLFRDIALAVVASVSLSLIVSVTVIPAACSRWLRLGDPSHMSAPRRAAASLFGLAPLAERLVRRSGDMIRWMITGWRGWTVRPAVIVAMTAVSLVGAWLLMPPMDYLPAGNRNLVFGGLLIPPGYSVDQQVGIAERIESRIQPYADADIDDPASVAALDPIPRRQGAGDTVVFDPVPVENFFIGAFGGGMFLGATSQDPRIVIPVGSLLTNAMGTIPDTYGGARQSSVFGRGIGGGNAINVEISGPDLDRVTAAAGMMFGLAGGEYGYGNVRADPANFNIEQQEFQVRLTRQGRELGLTTDVLGTAVRGLFDGAFVGDYEYQGDTIDLLVLPLGGRIDYKERLAEIPVTTPRGTVVPLDSVVELRPALAAQQVVRIEELPAVSVSVIPPQGRALEDVMREVQERVIAPARAAGMIDRTMRVRLEGTAADLDEVKASLLGKAASERSRLATPAEIVGVLIVLGFAGLGVFVLVRAWRRGRASIAYGAAGSVLLGLVLAGLVVLIGTQPQLGMARMVWALAVTYLLMSALFESFTYPFVIMFSVPLAVVGGFAGLRIVHDMTMADPTIAPQQLDVLTMLGFVILIGVVVNNAILIVHQSLNFLRSDEINDPHEAVAESVRTRVRPIFMSTLTSVGGMLPLVLFPGAGSEMYRGLGSVVIGGLLCSTVFTLLLVPLVLSLVFDMSAGLRTALGASSALPAVEGVKAPEGERKPELQAV